MSEYYINVSLRVNDAARVRECICQVFTAHGFTFLDDAPAARVTDDDDLLPDGENWYGIVVSGVSGTGWVTVYVEDWADSGVLARELSQTLQVPALEVWVADAVHWGYTYYEAGDVIDRYADDPSTLASGDEAALYRGQASRLAAVLSTSSADALQSALAVAQAAAGTFAGPGVDSLAQAVGLPFEHVFTGYEFFFTDDPEDYGPSLEKWPAFRHLAFQSPPGRDTLAE